jgi:hypothetical protein
MNITRRLHIDTIEAEAFRTFMRIYPLLKSDRVSSVKLAFHKTLIKSVITYDFPGREFAAENPSIEMAATVEFFATLANFLGAHRYAICMRLTTLHTFTIKLRGP